MAEICKAQVTDLMVETTRWCDMRCEHCLRDDPENVKMPPIYLENLFKRISSIDMLTFTGGEPSFGTDAMYKCLELCSRYGIPVREVYLATNGKNVHRKFLDILRQWDGYCRETQCGRKKSEYIGGTDAYHMVKMLTSEIDGHVGLRLDLSMDRFHEDIPVENILALMSLPGTLGTGKYHPEDDDSWILRTGRAEWNGMGREDTKPGTPWAYGENARNVSMDQWGDGTWGIESLYVSCDGNLCRYCDYSYTDIEDYAIGSLAGDNWLDKLVKQASV